MTFDPRRIAVVGGGLSGLAAARRLAGAGRDVVVFDKGRRPGGRSSTRRSDGHAFDHGAQYFTVRDPRFAEVVADWKLRGVAARWEAPIRTLADGVVGWPRSEARRFVGVPGMSHLARDLAVSLDVRSGIRIERLEGDRGGWKLSDAVGSGHEGFDAVIVATPPAQAAPLLVAAPALCSRIDAVTLRPCLAVMVAFATPLHADFGGAFVSGGPLAWVSREASKPSRSAGERWVLHASPAWSAARLEEPPDSAIDPLLRAFDRSLGGRGLPEVVHRSAHRWRHAMAQEALGTSCLWDERTGLGACGDWASDGRVEGAFLSGHALAGALLGEAEPGSGA